MKSRRVRLHALYAITRQKEIRWTMIPRDGQRCPRARGHMLRIFMTLPSLYRSDYVPPKNDFTLVRYTSLWRQCRDHCATRVETRDHQRSLSSTNRIWHRPNRSRGSPERACRWTRCTCNIAVNRRVQGFRSYRWLRRQCVRQKASRFECLCC